MKKIILLLAVFLMTACAHQVAFNQPGEKSYSSRVPIEMAFYMDQGVKRQVYSARAFSSGIANSWHVPVGTVVHDYAVANLNGGFNDFREVGSENGISSSEMLLKITSIDYHMAGQAAHFTVRMIVQNSSGASVFEKSYRADGPSGYGRVFMGGALAQKSAIRQSTDSAMADIFAQFMDDARANYSGWH